MRRRAGPNGSTSLPAPGHRDTGTPGHRDTGTPGHRDTGTPGHRDTGTPGHRDTGTPGHRDTGTPGHRDTGTPGHRDTGTPGLRDSGTPGLRDSGTPGLRDQHPRPAVGWRTSTSCPSLPCRPNTTTRPAQAIAQRATGSHSSHEQRPLDQRAASVSRIHIAVGTAGSAGYLEPGDRLEARPQASGPLRPEPSRTLEGAHSRRPMGSIPPGPVPPSTQGSTLSAAGSEACPTRPPSHARTPLREQKWSGALGITRPFLLTKGQRHSRRNVELVIAGGRRQAATDRGSEEWQDHGAERDTS
ncbi:hypothetical protein EDF53_3841 [Curtobacterium sp. PhB78]|nr:hypothetical protein EDF53_3841 [Curtobacterium sp. PhB78]